MPGLEDLYREIILDHYRKPRNKGEIENPDASVQMKNPLCGDEITGEHFNIRSRVVIAAAGIARAAGNAASGATSVISIVPEKRVEMASPGASAS